MRCVTLKGKRKFEIKEIDEPKSDHDSVLIDVIKCGICGFDIHYWDLGGPVGLIMGHEYVGRVIDNGSREDIKVGDRVTALPISPCMKCAACQSGNIQYCTHTWDEATGLSLTYPGALAPKTRIRPDMVIKVPENVTDNEAAMTEPVAVGLHAVHLADIKVGDRVLVIGSGMIGMICAMFAKMEGATYVAVSEKNIKRGRKAVSLNVSDEWFDANHPDCIKMLESKQFDIVLDCSGNSAAVSTAIQVVKPGGTVILVGVSLNTITIPSIQAVMKELTLKGAISYTRKEFETCLSLMDSKQINVSKFVSEIVGLDDVQSSYERLTSGTDDAIKILVDPNK